MILSKFSHQMYGQDQFFRKQIFSEYRVPKQGGPLPLDIKKIIFSKKEGMAIFICEYRWCLQDQLKLMTEESFTKPELKEILDKRISSNSDSDEKTFKFRDREFVILRNVFSPTFFPNTHWYTNTFLDNMPHVASLLEIGTGAGNVLAEALLLKKCEWGVGSDITPEAVENAALNFKRFEVNAEAVVSDVLDSLNKEWRFDLMYWNYPYHHDFGKQDYKDMSPIELSLRDPNYSHLDKLLATAKPFLKSTGFIIISFSFQMGNTHRLQQLTKLHGWTYSIFVQRPGDQAQKLPQLCLLKLTPTK